MRCDAILLDKATSSATSIESENEAMESDITEFERGAKLSIVEASESAHVMTKFFRLLRYRATMLASQLEKKGKTAYRLDKVVE